MSFSVSGTYAATSVQMASLQALIKQQAESFNTFGGQRPPAFGENTAMPTPATGVGTQLDVSA